VFTNPYFGQPTGWMPEVKNFVATAATPRKMRAGTNIAQDKLSLELALTPIVTTPETQPEPEPGTALEPNADPDPETDPGLDEGISSNPTTGSTLGGCSTGGSTGYGFLALLGLALLGVTRRRN